MRSDNEEKKHVEDADQVNDAIIITDTEDENPLPIGDGQWPIYNVRNGPPSNAIFAMAFSSVTPF